MQAALTHSPPLQSQLFSRGRRRDWRRERPFLLTLAIRAFPSVTDIPLKSSGSSLHTSARSGGCAGLAGCSCMVCAGIRWNSSPAVGTSSLKLLPHSTLRARKWGKLVMQ